MTISASDIRNMSSTATARDIPELSITSRRLRRRGIDTPLACATHAQLGDESAHFSLTREFASGAAYEAGKDLGILTPEMASVTGPGPHSDDGRGNYQERPPTFKHMNRLP